MSDSHTNRKRGNRLGFWFFETSLRLFGLSGAYGLLYIVCLYYLVFDRPVFASSLAYIKRRFRGCNTYQGVLGVYKLLVNQGKMLVDRYYVVSGLGRFEIEIKGGEKIKDYLKGSGKGLVLLTAHTGNWQVTMTALERFNKTVYLLMRPEDNAAVRDSLGVDAGGGMLRIIPPQDVMGSILEMVRVINEGNLVSIMGDRHYGAESMEVDFLGDKAAFPCGAFSLAAAVQCPVAVILSAKVSAQKYVVEVSDFIKPCYHVRQRRREEIKGWVQEFARILEDYVSRYPFQWFAFHDIWVTDHKSDREQGG